MGKILIVEDNKSLNKALKDKFKKEGFEVFSAFDGRECLEILDKNKPDVILMDLAMPHMDGNETIKHLRENNDVKNIPLIILSNLSDMDNISKVMSEGVYEYLVKSDHSLEQIVNKVRRRIEQ